MQQLHGLQPCSFTKMIYPGIHAAAAAAAPWRACRSQQLPLLLQATGHGAAATAAWPLEGVQCVVACWQSCCVCHTSQ